MRRPDVALILIALLIPSLRTGPAFAGDFQDAHETTRVGNWVAAYELLRPLAERGDASAQNDIGFMYCKGLGVPLDHTEAVRWYRKAAEQGTAEAQIHLGFLFENGRDVPWDCVLAHMRYGLAASRFPVSEMENRNRAKKRRDGLASRMTPAQIAEARRLAREWKPGEGKWTPKTR